MHGFPPQDSAIGRRFMACSPDSRGKVQSKVMTVPRSKEDFFFLEKHVL